MTAERPIQRTLKQEPKRGRAPDNPSGGSRPALEPAVAEILALQGRAGNAAVASLLDVQRAPATPAHAPTKAVSGPATNPDPLRLIQFAGTEIPRIRDVYLVGFRGAVDALDAPAVSEIARVIVDDSARVERACLLARRQLDEARAESQAQHDLQGELRLVETQLNEFKKLLAIQMSPQLFRGEPVAGSFAPPEFTDLGFISSEAGTVINLLVVARQVEIQVARPLVTSEDRLIAATLIEGWRSRPINLLFLRRVLMAKQLWSKVIGATGTKGQDLGGIVQDQIDQAKVTGVLGDVGEFDAAKASELLSYRVGHLAISDKDAIAVFDMVKSVAPNMRGKVLAQLDAMGKLDRLCDNLPWKYTEAMWKAVPDPAIRAKLEPYFKGKGGGKSLSTIYEQNIMKDIGEGKMVRAYGWTFLLTAHGALTYGFLGAHDQAYDLSEQGWISSDAYISTTAKAAARSAVIAAATYATGGAAGTAGEGFAQGLGASETVAKVVGAGVGGGASGIAGQFTADVYDQALMEKEGFSSGKEYLLAGGVGVASGVAGLGAQKLGASAAKALAQYTGLPETGFLASEQALARTYANRYPAADNVLARIRGSGVRTGLVVRVSAQELIALVKAGAVSPANLQAALGRIGAVYANDRIDISQEALSKFFPQSDIEKYFGNVDPKTGRVTIKDPVRGGRGFAAKKSDITAADRASDQAVRRAMGLEPKGPAPGWKPPTNYQKYFNPNDPLFEVVFQSDAELDVPLPRENAKGVPLGTTNPKNLHVAGTGRTAGGVAEGVVPTGAPIKILSIKPVGTPRAGYPSTGATYTPSGPPTPQVRGLDTALGTTPAANLPRNPPPPPGKKPTIQPLALQRAAGEAAIQEPVAHGGQITIQRDGGHSAVAAPAASTTALDDRAHAIVNAAQADHPAIDQRAISTVRQIINTYYADRASTVSDVTYDSSEPGLMTTSVGHGASSTGSIAVGEYFVTNTTAAEFARRVLQVGHELEHIQQYRAGLGGGGHRHEREFLAFYHEGTGTTVAHTGRMAHSTRVRLIDEAIRHYNAFSAADKERFAAQYRDLLEQRSREQHASGRDATPVPTEAAR